MLQLAIAERNAMLDAIETTIGTAPTLELRTGSPPATCATADSGTLLDTRTLPSDWMAAASGGSKAIAGTWTPAGASNSGTFGHFRIKASSTCRMQGTAGVAVAIATSALTAAGGTVLTFASTTGVAVGMRISGTGVASGAYVAAVTGTTATMSIATSGGVSSAATITFRPDMELDAATVTAAQLVNVTACDLTMGHA